MYFKGILYLIYILLVSLFISLLSSSIVYAAPTNQNVQGYVFNNDSSGVENGIPVIVNNINTNQNFTTEVFAPPIPSEKGAYSLTILGSNGDLLQVRSYNDTHYGESYHTIVSTTSNINVTLNLTRGTELNVTINDPTSNDTKNFGTLFNISFTVDASVVDATSCIAYISFSNMSVINSTEGLSKNLGTITMGSSANSNFELESYSLGTSDITISVNCSNEIVNFESQKVDTVYNISISDSSPPIVNLSSPANNSEEKTSNLIVFEYVATNETLISECRLYINSSLNETDSDVTPDTTQTINVTLPNGNYSWYVECEDPFSQNGTSETRYHTVSVYYPNITQISLPSNIILNAGSTKFIESSITIEDKNGANDISGVNATFYLNGSGGSPDNQSIHYTNTSCSLTSTSGDLAYYNCSFNLIYFAYNGTWIVNVTAIDQQGLQGNSYNSTNVDTLYAVNVSTLLIDYGDIPLGNVSSDVEVNVFNLGNQYFELSVRGYGGSDPVTGDGLAMRCDSNKNISVSNMRYSLLASIAFESKTNLSSSDVLTGLQVPIEGSNNMFWQLYVPPVQISECTGTVVFTATQP